MSDAGTDVAGSVPEGAPEGSTPSTDTPATAPATELPHWTEPPTGQVPAVLARDEGETQQILPPTWREDDADWTAHEEEFDTSMFSDERASLGALDESGGDDETLRPWEFDLDSVRPGQPGPGAAADPITEPVPVVTPEDGPARGARRSHRGPAAATTEAVESPRPRGPGTPVPPRTPAVDLGVLGRRHRRCGDRRRISGADGTDGGHRGGGDVERGPRPRRRRGCRQRPPDEDDEAGRPSGTPRVGRARRSGLLPARLTAKRPDEDVAPVAEPLAAEPPGASVADVPGAGRRRAGLASLAAADRAAEESAPASSVSVAPAGTDEGTAAPPPHPVLPRRPARGPAPTTRPR